MIRRFKWVCECCYRTSREQRLPATWKLVWQSAICNRCVDRAVELNLGYATLKGGQWAGARKDPRAKARTGCCRQSELSDLLDHCAAALTAAGAELWDIRRDLAIACNQRAQRCRMAIKDLPPNATGSATGGNAKGQDHE